MEISKTVKPNPEQMVPEGEDKSTQVKNLLQYALRVERGFRAAIKALTFEFNSIESMEHMIRAFGLDEDFVCGEMGVDAERFEAR